MKRKILFLIGPQGCGKGTQGKKLAVFLGVPHREMSAMLNSRAAEDDERADYIKDTMSSGGLVSSDVVVAVMLEAMNKNDWDSVIIDGFPRLLGQAEEAVKLAEEHDVKFFVFDLSDEVCLERMAGRVADIKLMQEKRRLAGLPPLKVRDDEDEEKQARRLALYRLNEGIINDYLIANAPGCFHRVDASGTPEEVFASLLSKI